MIDEKTLFSLADHPRPIAARALADVTQRTRQLRRQRRLGVLGVTSAVVVAAIAVTGPLLLPKQRSAASVTVPADQISTPPTTISAPDTGVTVCDPMGSAAGGRNLSPARAKVAYLPPESLIGKLPSPPVLTLWSKQDCDVMPPEPVGWYAMNGGTVSSGLGVAGPGAPSDLAPWKGYTSRFDLNGTTADLGFDASVKIGHAEWLVDGQRWSAEASGLTQAQVIAALKTVVITDGQVDVSWIPAGLTAVSPTVGGPPPATTWQENQVTLLMPAQAGEDPMVSSPKFSFDVTYGDSRSLAPGVGDRPVTINGNPGWIGAVQSGQTLVWQLAEGTRARLIDYTGEIGTEGLLAIATATVPVPADDPRW